MRVLGINAIFHDPSAALVIDGRVVAAAEEERFSRRKHGKRPVPFSAWELPEMSAAWCRDPGPAGPDDLEAVAYSFNPGMTRGADEIGVSDLARDRGSVHAEEVGQCGATALPGLDADQV